MRIIQVIKINTHYNDRPRVVRLRCLCCRGVVVWCTICAHDSCFGGGASGLRLRPLTTAVLVLFVCKLFYY